MTCPDCKSKVLSCHEYCKKCGASLYRMVESRGLTKREHPYHEFSLTETE